MVRERQKGEQKNARRLVAREQRCRVGVLDAQLHTVGPMMIVIALACTLM